MRTSRTFRSRVSGLRRVGWLAVAGLTIIALVGPGAGASLAHHDGDHNSVNAISVGACFDAATGMTGTLDATVAQAPFTVKVWVADHKPGQGYWAKISGSEQTLTISASNAAVAFGPLSTANHRSGVNSYRVETDGGIAKSASISPCSIPSPSPSAKPSADPSVAPSVDPSVAPSTEPSADPSVAPSVDPSVAPSTEPSVAPSTEPSARPSPQTHCIWVYKVDGNNVGLAGAGFTVYQDGKAVSPEFFSETDGWAWTCGLPDGEYTVRETTVPDGYLAAADVTVSLPGPCPVVEPSTTSGTAAPKCNCYDGVVKMVDEPSQPPVDTYCITVHKDNSHEAALAGAGFTLFDSEGAKALTDEAFTNSDGLVSFCRLAAGTYTVRETTAPAGYLAVADVTISVPQDCEQPSVVGARTAQHPACEVVITLIDKTAPSPAPSASVDPSASSSGGVLAATGRPKVTPPSTSTVSGVPGGPAGDAWRIALLALAGLLASILLLTPTVPRAARRTR